ncbi:MAG: nickel pincer cofactor biosynthesis protein LarB [Lachnospiraceae bacterium]|nr:nickel pincer cofactor biosynthesis protein LarB [Lachnospiraceae bacterium]
MNDVRELLQRVKEGSVSPEEAELLLRKKPFVELGFANIDTQREIRTGVPEIIYGAGKSAGMIDGILTAMQEEGQESILITKLSEEKAAVLSTRFSMQYDAVSKVAVVGPVREPDGIGRIVIVTAGTSDIPVAEEAYQTARFLGNEVVTVYDVGVAGLHRLLAKIDVLMSATVIIAIAGMEGALASVIGGLVDCPVIAVPSSVGYGASLNGLSALLAMINSCANGISVVNIDNGFGAAYQASLINHVRRKTASDGEENG